MTTWPYARGLRAPERPPSPEGGAVRVPSSKSAALRAIVLAARADWVSGSPAPPDEVGEVGDGGGGGDAISIGPLPADELGGDVAAALRVAEALGARVAREGERVLVTPRPANHRPPGRVELDVGESATLARFATAIAALDTRYADVRVAGAGTLARRRSPALFRTLAAWGVELEHEAAADGWPVRIRGRTLGPPQDLGAPKLCVDEPVSSQEVSALLLAGDGPDAGHPDVSVRGEIPSRPYLDLTVGALRAFGLDVRETPDFHGKLLGRGPGRRLFAVHPAGASAPRAIELEPDASLAAVALAAACLAGGELCVPGIRPGTAQGDARIGRHLRAFGCDAGLEERGLCAGGRPTRGAHVELAGQPDLAPVLAAVAADAALRLGARSRLSGLGTLAGKESDRFAGIAAALSAAGADVVPEGREALVVRPRRGGERRAADGELVLDARGDHRMAFLHALLGLVVPGVVTRDGRPVAKTWPAFWEELERLGFVVVRGA